MDTFTTEQLDQLRTVVREELSQLGTPRTAPQATGKLLSQKQAWQYCGLTRSEWYRMRSEGTLPGSVAGNWKHPKWRRSDLDVWLERMKLLRT